MADSSDLIYTSSKGPDEFLRQFAAGAGRLGVLRGVADGVLRVLRWWQAGGAAVAAAAVPRAWTRRTVSAIRESLVRRHHSPKHALSRADTRLSSQ